jgi:hypothetical protein
MENYHTVPSSAGTTSLRKAVNDNAKFDYLNELREHFTKFENEVWNYDSLRPNEAFKIDLRLPLLLLETFTKLFRLWRDFAAFQKLIKAELFREINDDMNAYFESDISHFKFYCDACDRNIAVEGNDLKYSYELHAQDNHHQEVLNYFNYLICPSTRHDVDLKNDAFIDEVSQDDANNSRGFIIISANNQRKCSSCDRSFSSEQEAIHFRSWSRRLEEMNVGPTDVDYIVEIDGEYYCRSCYCTISRKHPQDHFSNEAYEVREECHKILRENGSQVALLNNNCGEFMCKSCDVSGDCWDALLEHCRSSNHCERQNCSRKTSSTAELNSSDDFIIFNNDRYECLLCQLILNRWEIIEHKREKKHMEKHFAIQNHNELGVGLLNSSTESDGYNDAFKNNDIYIEINLRDDDSEIFKCLLCNKTGKGLDNLDVHCLTPIHQKHKKHIESVSKVYANCDTSNEPVGTIKGLDDLYYCQICDVLIEDEATVNKHIEEKEHIQLELVQKVLNENGACISLLTEEPTRLYHCQLCSRLIDGDTNIVGHGNSNRHTQLLNTVKVLSRNRLMKTIQ